MKTIVCPVDFSPISENAANYASQLAKEFDSRLILFHVYDTPVVLADSSVVISQEIETTMVADFEKRMEKLKNDLLSRYKLTHIDTKEIKGLPVREICKLASDEEADAIIMGSTGKGKAERVFLGSTSSKVIAEAKCPVLIIPKEVKYTGIKRIVFATDLNNDNLNAARQIIPIARHFNAEISFVFVDNKNGDDSDKRISNMAKNIRSHVNYNRISGYVSKSITLTGGIEFFVEKHPADLLVMMKHDRQFPETLFNPSVTRKMSQLTKIPLISLPAESQVIAEV